jgi:hypothetical protein
MTRLLAERRLLNRGRVINGPARLAQCHFGIDGKLDGVDDEIEKQKDKGSFRGPGSRIGVSSFFPAGKK